VRRAATVRSKSVCYGGHGEEKPCDEKQKQKSKPVCDGGHGDEK
jgi:hypothetical protein